MDNGASSAYMIIQVQKWGFLAVIFAIIIYTISKTIEMGKDINLEGKQHYMWIFAGLSYLIVLVSSLVRDWQASSDDDDSKGESFMDFVPNLVITTIWYIYMGVALGYNLINPPKRFSKGGKGGLRGGASVSVSEQGATFTLGDVKDKMSYLMYMGIAITLINVFSNLYMYYNCKDDGCAGDDETLINSLIGAQYNIILIGLGGIVIFMISQK